MRMRMMSDDADDVDADGADDNVGDNDGVFFSLALAQANGLAHATAGRAHVCRLHSQKLHNPEHTDLHCLGRIWAPATAVAPGVRLHPDWVHASALPPAS